jgi:hypothetical protein
MLETEHGLMVLSIGGADDADSAMEVYGFRLAYRVTLRGPEIQLAAVPMDGVDAWDLLLRAPDSPAGWVTLRGVIGALETHKITNLTRPIEAWDGFDGASGWVIG